VPPVVEVEQGDMRRVLAKMIEAGRTVHAVVTDPPYHLQSIVKRFGGASKDDDTKTSHDARTKSHGYARLSRGFMGKQWDGGDVAFDPETWRLVFHVLPPGGHVLAFASTRNYHRMATAIEDAGFEIRDQVAWLYGSGFPKSHNVADGIRKRHPDADPSTAEGWGTAIKPAFEPICVARKPVEGTVAANFLKYGTGALNTLACGIPSDGRPLIEKRIGEADTVGHQIFGEGLSPGSRHAGTTSADRWPANVVHDGSREVSDLLPDAGGGVGVRGGRASDSGWGFKGTGESVGLGDSGSAARFFYCAKASEADRLESEHATVKPVALMRWLVRLVTPPGGWVLDPFAGSGTTAMACLAEGFNCIAVEREASHVADIRRRVAHVAGLDTPLFGPRDDSPGLFQEAAP
jgi:site-specific DNA-methyltransferase (adenine-specific)